MAYPTQPGYGYPVSEHMYTQLHFFEYNFKPFSSMSVKRSVNQIHVLLSFLQPPAGDPLWPYFSQVAGQVCD